MTDVPMFSNDVIRKLLLVRACQQATRETFGDDNMHFTKENLGSRPEEKPSDDSLVYNYTTRHGLCHCFRGFLDSSNLL